MFTVKVQVVPGGEEVLHLDQSTTVNRAINLAKVADPTQFTVNIGGSTVTDLDRSISENTTIVLIKKANIKGN